MTAALPYAMAFIDGQNLYQHAKEAFGYHHPNFDPLKLHAKVCAANGWRPSLVRFYTGVPLALHDELWAGYWSNRVLAMKRSGINVTTRPLKYRIEEAFDDRGIPNDIVVAQEKGIDVRIALDIVNCALSKQFDVAVIYSQDQDLNEVVPDINKAAASTGRQIKLACAFPSSSSASSRRGINGTQWLPIERAEYDTCLDPRDYRPAKFKT
jgi:uncharacterized LabA/DUF88 family protein